jgi:hypothetical protein
LQKNGAKRGHLGAKRGHLGANRGHLGGNGPIARGGFNTQRVGSTLDAGPAAFTPVAAGQVRQMLAEQELARQHVAADGVKAKSDLRSPGVSQEPVFCAIGICAVAAMKSEGKASRGKQAKSRAESAWRRECSPSDFDSVVLPHTPGRVRKHTAGVRRKRFSHTNDARDRAAGGDLCQHLRSPRDLAELRNFVHGILVDGETLAITVAAVATHIKRRAAAVDGFVVGARFVHHARGVGEGIDRGGVPALAAAGVVGFGAIDGHSAA